MTLSDKTLKLEKFGVAGAGAWGTALAVVAANGPKGARDVVLWSFEPETVGHINQSHENTAFLPGVALPHCILATQNIEDLAACDAVLMVVPAQFARPILKTLSEVLKPSTPIILCSKGIEQSTLMLMSDVAAEYFAPERIAVLSGPSFAADVARGFPTAVTLACADNALGHAISKGLGQPSFRPYLSSDIIGTEIGGAIKNVIAIACGIVEGKKLGESARAAVTARGFSEMINLGQAIGGHLETMAGLSGLGDLILTAGSKTSRNFSLGLALGQGQSVSAVLGARQSVSEGAMSARAVQALATKHKVEMPICAAVDKIINDGLSVDTAIRDLLDRPFAHERDED